MKKDQKKHLLALGSYGSSFFSSYAKDLKLDSFTVINDIDPNEDEVPYKYIFFPEKKLFSNITARKKMPERLKEILTTLDGDIFCIAALGFGSGNGLYEAIGQFVKTLENPEKIKFISLRPPEKEGRYPVEVAERVVLGLTDLNQRSISLEDLKIGYGLCTSEEYFLLGDHWVLKQIG
ncbi:hypothetical protein [Algoriphagus formosus]|uniref:hypothetical protein n=1 Tax=Algoriphagus formosus TaxID=2007308 RepID=UPI000C293982|nr:hypothetical protein [Algoriphagus formosus]